MKNRKVIKINIKSPHIVCGLVGFWSNELVILESLLGLLGLLGLLVILGSPWAQYNLSSQLVFFINEFTLSFIMSS